MGEEGVWSVRRWDVYGECEKSLELDWIFMDWNLCSAGGLPFVLHIPGTLHRTGINSTVCRLVTCSAGASPMLSVCSKVSPSLTYYRSSSRIWTGGSQASFTCDGIGVPPASIRGPPVDLIYCLVKYRTFRRWHQ
ncbi:hypothetical protein HAX54_018437 [Datura stramonium]|uniref:Uncharacterized protein n=1 Tax=Datura stramonium TaxID=4076 RepID=A0ABS8UPC7_DATST|nr:hypothetical protein [Datura stramonium]